MKLSVVLMVAVWVLAVAIMATIIAFIPKQAVNMGAPEDIKEKVQKYHRDYPKWVSIVGFILLALEVAAVILVFVYGGYDAHKNNLEFTEIFIRYLMLLDGYKLFDMFFFDYVMLTKLNILPKLFPETEGCKGYDSFGFNAKSQVAKLCIFALVAAVIAFIIVQL